MSLLSPWDLRLAARTLALTVVALVAIALVEWFTSERGVAAGTTGAAIGPLPLAPVATAIAVSIALVPARTSGELRALAALGASPLRARAAALVVAALVGLFAALAIATGRVDASPLYPSPRPPTDWHVIEGPHGVAFASARRRARVEEGRLDRDATIPESAPISGPPPHARGAAGLAIAIAALALASFSASPFRRRPMRSLVAFALYGASQVAAFQIAAARALPAPLVALPPTALLLLAALELRAERRLRAEEAWL